MLDELQRLRETIKQCVARARVARQQAIRDKSHCRIGAEELRNQAAGVRSPDMRVRLLRLASLYEALSKADGPMEISSEIGFEVIRDRDPPSTNTQTTSIEDPSARARRLLAKAQAQFQRQLAFLAVLPNDDREIALRARIALSRALCYNSRVMLRQARDMLDRVSTRSTEGEKQSAPARDMG